MNSRRSLDHWLVVLTVAFSALSAAAVVIDAAWQPQTAATTA
jgi:hypothetical protein